MDSEGKYQTQIFYNGTEYRIIYSEGNHAVGVRGRECKAWDLRTGKQIELPQVENAVLQKVLAERRKAAQEMGYEGDINDYGALEKFIEHKAEQEIQEFRSRNASLAEELGIDINRITPKQFIEKVNLIMQLISTGRPSVSPYDKSMINEENLKMVKNFLGRGFEVSKGRDGTITVFNKDGKQVEILDIKRGREVIKNEPEGNEQRYALVRIKGTGQLSWVSMAAGKALTESQDIQDSKGNRITLYSSPDSPMGCSLTSVRQQDSSNSYLLREIVSAEGMGDLRKEIVAVNSGL